MIPPGHTHEIILDCVYRAGASGKTCTSSTCHSRYYDIYTGFSLEVISLKCGPGIASPLVGHTGSWTEHVELMMIVYTSTFSEVAIERKFTFSFLILEGLS